MLTSPDYKLALQTPADEPAINILHENTFGPGRFARTAFRIRETAAIADELCLVAFSAKTGNLIGSVILSHITIGSAPSLLLGPLAVLPEYKNKGAGKLLMRQAVESARSAGYDSILLVGDEQYYGPFGFQPVPRGQLELPGPVDPARLLICILSDGEGFTAAGEVRGSCPSVEPV